jgi:predicted DNA binding CopG/RHH family protein
MKDRYDFSKSVKNPYLRSPKKQITIRLDEESIMYFKGMSEDSGIPYQSLINLYLRDCVAKKKQLQLKWAS